MNTQDIVELNLSRAVNTTNTNFIRASLADRIDRNNLSGPPVELVRFNVFLHCTSGSGTHMVDFVEHNVNRGTAMWIQPGQVQRWSDTDDGFDADVMVFASSMIPDLPLFDHLVGETAIANTEDHATHLQRLMAWMAADLEISQDESTAAAVVSVVLRVFARAFGATAQTPDTRAQRLVAALIESVDGNTRQRSVAWHASRLGASTRTLARATAEARGQSPKAVVDSRVVLEAKRRLAWSADDISTVARSLGFSDSSNFTKFFRTQAGMSPSTYRGEVRDLGSTTDYSAAPP